MTVSDKISRWYLRIGICAWFCVALSGCQPKHEQPTVQPVETPSALPGTQPNAAPTPDETPVQPEVQKCPDHDDVRASIKEGNKQLNATEKLYVDSKNNANLSEVDVMETAVKKWQHENKELLAGAPLLLGADGTSVYPEIPLALQNVALAARWMEYSLKSSRSGDTRASGLYLKASKSALLQATRVLDKKVKAIQGSAVIKTPLYLKGLRKCQ